MKTHSVSLFPRLAVVLGLALGSIIAIPASGKVAAWGDNNYGQCLLPNGLKGVKAIAAGYNHSLALRSDGTVIGWGDNYYFQSRPPTNLSGVVAIAAGGSHSLALRANGTVVAWGNAYYGQSAIPSGLAGVVAIAEGTGHSLALKVDGTVTAWGWGAYGQTNVPTDLSNVIAIAASTYHSLALKADGTVVAWGSGMSGNTNVPAGLTDVVAVAAGYYQSLALKSDGSVVVWGDGYSGQTNPPAGLSNIVAIAAGESQSLALKTDGTVIAWGFESPNVPAGLANVTAIATGADHALALVPAGPPEILEQPTNLGVTFHSNAVLSVVASGFEPLHYRWYFNSSPLTDYGRIFGATNATLTISNAQFSDIGKYSVMVGNGLGVVQSTGAVLTVISPPSITLQPVGRTVIAGTNIILTAAATGTPPLSYRWLFGGVPLAGVSGTSLSLSNVQSSQSGNYSLLVSNLYGVTESSNALVTVLESPPYILTQPTNRVSFLGGTATFTVNARGSTPLHYQWRLAGLDIPGATNATLSLTALRSDQSGYYSVVISNAFGGIISAKAQLSVNQIAVWGSGSGLTNAPAGLTNIVALAAGESHLLALKSDGTVVAWSGARLGFGLPIGFPTFVNPATNVPAGLIGVIAIAAGSSHNLAVRSNGTVVAWGDNSFGQTNVPAGLSNVIAVAAGDFHSLALRADGKVVAWGARSTGFPLHTYTALTNVPPGLSNVVAIAAGADHSLALKNDGKVVAWGLPNTTRVPASLSNVIAIACGGAANLLVRPVPGSTSTFDLALRSDGTVVPWSTGLAKYLVPPTGLSNVVGIAAWGHGMALKDDGSVVQWGLANPPPIGLSNVTAMAAGYGFAAAVIGNGSPVFTLQPVGQTVVRGGKVQFHARAVGLQPMTYRWQVDGVNLPGATNADLTITNAQGTYAGVYQLVVANALGSVSSATAMLTIPFSTNLAAALSATNLTWTTTPTNAPWFAQIRETHDGDVAAQSGPIGHGQQSTLQATVVGPGTLTFWWKVSSEDGYDRLWFSMDALNWAGWISGETDWQPFTFQVPVGPHTLRWAYTKDATVATGQDAGWLDQVMFTPTPPLALTAPRLLSNGSFEFGSSAVGRTLLPEHLARIEIQASTNLRDWITLTGVCTLTNGSLQICDPQRPNHPQRFYRIIEH